MVTVPLIDFTPLAERRPLEFAPWIHGSPEGVENLDPAIQVQGYGEHTFVLRQNKSVHYEAPFLYLFFGNDRAILFDTGATSDPALFPLRATVDTLVAEWLTAYPRDDYELVVAHSHSHNDHYAADAQFADRPDTTVVGVDVDAVRDFYGFGDDLAEIVQFDLGGRRLEIMRAPGHDEPSIVVFDPFTGWLLTGDTVYPGRLYVADAAAFIASVARVAALAASRNVSQVMGCHIEMSAEPGVDYPIGSTFQPNEPALELPPTVLAEIGAVADEAHVAGRYVYDSFIIVSRI